MWVNRMMNIERDAYVRAFGRTKTTDRTLMNETCVRSTGRLNANWIMCCILTIDIHTAASISSSKHSHHTFVFSHSLRQPDDFQLHTDLIGFGACCCCYSCNYYYTVSLFSLLFEKSAVASGWGLCGVRTVVYTHYTCFMMCIWLLIEVSSKWERKIL